MNFHSTHSETTMIVYTQWLVQTKFINHHHHRHHREDRSRPWEASVSEK